MYLLGGLESKCTSSGGGDLPPYGPTLSDVFMPNMDRHSSGLNCLKRDHLRGLTGVDLDLAPMQNKQSKFDYLTDSESDEEDKYSTPPPSMKRVQALLSGIKLDTPSLTGNLFFFFTRIFE